MCAHLGMCATPCVPVRLRMRVCFNKCARVYGSVWVVICVFVCTYSCYVCVRVRVSVGVCVCAHLYPFGCRGIYIGPYVYFCV